MEGRGGVRSSARLCGGGGGGVGGEPARSEPAACSARNARPVAAAAAAALRRARAAERAREVEDSPRVLKEKCRRLARAVRNAKHLVVYTGAGISTAADIPDYRGPHGVWTRLQRGETVGRVEVSRARPTFTHMALTALWARGALKFVVSQNCDGLHVRAGLPRRALAELHGDMFAEHCGGCRRVYLRAFDTTERTARHAHGTRRLCHACALELRDTIVHFGERGRAAWPLNWAGALRHAQAADVILCLGSSLKVLRRYPRLWCMHRAPHARPALYVVNLQWTPKDSVAALKINARCDQVMAEVARRLRLRVPRYRARRDPLLAHATPLAPPEAHTTRRPLLRAAAPASPSPPASPASPSSPSSPASPASPSASDSDEERPLRELADRLRGPPAAAALAPAPASRPPDPLRAFQVSMRSGEATILLRAEHAPSTLSSPESRPSDCAPSRKTISDLRSFRIARRTTGRPEPAPDIGAALNGHERTSRLTPDGDDDGETRTFLVSDIKIKKEEENDVYDDNSRFLDSKLRRLLEYEPRIGAKDETKEAVVKPEPKDEDVDSSSSEESTAAARAGSLAAAIIRRAVLVCRASLYPGLHTIIAGAAGAGGAGAAARGSGAGEGGGGGGGGGAEAGAGAGGECAWCARHYSSRRCLWYPAARTAAGARAWRRVGGRRYLCACCGDDDAPDSAAERDRDRDPVDDGGWYGKGYRKGRRKRR